MKKTLSCMLALVLTLALLAPVLAGAETAVNTDGYPIVNEPITLRVLASLNNYVEDLETNGFTKYYEDLTGIHLEFEMVPSAGKVDKLNAVMSSGDYPDILLNMSVAQETVFAYAAQGMFIPLTPYIDEYMPNLKAIIDTKPELASVLRYPDDNFYDVCKIEESYITMYPYKLYVYQPWLDALEIAPPTTTDELYEMLKAIKEGDPNQNGKADEIPFLSMSQMPWEAYLMTPFVYDDGAKRFIAVDGHIQAAYTQPEWKEGLKYIHKLYAEGLIAPETFTMQFAQLIGTLSNEDVIVGSIPMPSMSILSPGWADERDKNYYTIEPVKSTADGPAYAVYTPENNVSRIDGQVIITDKCKNPEAAARWIDGFLTQEMSMRAVFGENGVNIRDAEPDELGALGQPGVYTFINSWNQMQNFAWRRTAPHYRELALVVGEVYNIQGNENNPYLMSQKYVGHEPPETLRVPPLMLSSEELTRLADTDKSINDYVVDSLMRFTVGEIDIDAGWDNYLAELNRMGLEDYLKAYDAVYQGIKK